MAATLTTTLLRELRRNLLALKPAGEDGFEGLLAEALAAFTGLTIRLARSGSQFGRQGSLFRRASRGAACRRIVSPPSRWRKEPVARFRPGQTETRISLGEW